MEIHDELIPTRQSLLSRLKDWNDNPSWREFFDTYWQLMFKTARQAGLDPNESEEVVQETMISISKAIREFHYDPERGSFKGWLRKTITWRIRDHLRKKRKDHGVVFGMETDWPDQTISETLNKGIGENWDSDWEDSLEHAALSRVKKCVKPKQFQIFDLAVLRQWPTEKIAETFQVSRGYVYLVKHRLAARVKAELKKLRANPSPP